MFGELCRLYVEHHERICELWDEGEQTLIHGDTHAGNQFGDGDQVGLYDWAVISRSPGIRDVAIYLGNSCPTELRRARAGAAGSGRYHQIAGRRRRRRALVRRAVGPLPPLRLYAWVAATTTASMGSKWQPIEVGMLGMTRATDTCADLETVEAFRDVL